MILKAVTKLVFITYYSDHQIYRNFQFSKHMQQVLKFTDNRAYSNGILVEIVEDSLISIKFTKTLKKLLTEEMIQHNLEIASISEKLSVIHFDSLSFSYRDENSKIIGVEGNVIDEFCRLHNVPYEVINDGKGITSMPRDFDISLYRRLVKGPQHKYDITTINDVGSNQCFLVPKNIPMYSSRFSVPFDKYVNVLLLCSALFVAILWKIIRIYRKLKIEFFDLVTSMLKCIIGYSLPSNLHCIKWSIKERIFLVPFLFMCFILMNLFTSFMISTLIVELPMRSVQSVQELNESKLIIHEYYDQSLFQTTYKLKNLVLNRINSSAIQNIPSHFDKNLVYIVNCKFCEAYIKSARNFDNNHQTFDILRGFFFAVPYSTYLVHANFPLKFEFIKMVSSLQESGIMDYWSDHFIRGSFPNYSRDDSENSITLTAMQLPIFILITGLCVSILTFIIEWIYYKYNNWKLSHVIDLRRARQRHKRWIRIKKYFGINDRVENNYQLERERVVYEM